MSLMYNSETVSLHIGLIHFRRVTEAVHAMTVMATVVRLQQVLGDDFCVLFAHTDRSEAIVHEPKRLGNAGYHAGHFSEKRTALSRGQAITRVVSTRYLQLLRTEGDDNLVGKQENMIK